MEHETEATPLRDEWKRKALPKSNSDTSMVTDSLLPVHRFYLKGFDVVRPRGRPRGRHWLRRSTRWRGSDRVGVRAEKSTASVTTWVVKTSTQ